MLASSSESYDVEVLHTTWQCKFNWKLAYENLRDSNHVAYLHPRTLSPLNNFTVEVNKSDAQETLIELQNNDIDTMHKELKRFSLGGPDAQPREIKKFGWYEFVNRWQYSNFVANQTEQKSNYLYKISHSDLDDHYFNWLIYPNLHIVSGNGGYSFVIENHIPVDFNRTDLKLYRFTAKKKMNYPSSIQVLMSEMRHSKLILTEDYEVLENIQSNLHEGAPLPTQGAYESANRLVERWYTFLMETDCEL